MDQKVSILKRKIEKEFVDLFPSEPPFIVAKLEDEYGYSLSNNSTVGDFLKHGDRIIAQPEGMGGHMTLNEDGEPSMPMGRGLAGGGNTEDLIMMLKNLQ